MDTLLNLLPGKSPLEAAMGSSGQWSITASDGVKIAYERYGRLDDSRPVIVLIHGWSGERQRFTAAAPVAALLCLQPQLLLLLPIQAPGTTSI